VACFGYERELLFSDSDRSLSTQNLSDVELNFCLSAQPVHLGFFWRLEEAVIILVGTFVLFRSVDQLTLLEYANAFGVLHTYLVEAFSLDGVLQQLSLIQQLVWELECRVLDDNLGHNVIRIVEANDVSGWMAQFHFHMLFGYQQLVYQLILPVAQSNLIQREN